jgi:hypothetical protein
MVLLDHELLSLGLSSFVLDFAAEPTPARPARTVGLMVIVRS